MCGSSPLSVVKGDREKPEQNTQTHKLGVLPPKQTVENSIKGPAMMRGPRRFRSQKTWDGQMLKDKMSRGGNPPRSHSKHHCWASVWVCVLGPPNSCFLRFDRLDHSSLTNTRAGQLHFTPHDYPNLCYLTLFGLIVLISFKP